MFSTDIKMRRIFSPLARFFVLAFVVGLPARAQVFEKASIKRDSDGISRIEDHGRMHTGATLGRPIRGRLAASNVSLRFLIQVAYDVQPFQISGGPDWIDSEGFDLNAQTEKIGTLRDRSYTPPVPGQINAMLQTFLEDKFSLKVHRETRQMATYSLVPERPLNPPPPKSGSCAEDDRISGPVRDEAPLPPCGRVVFSVVYSGGTVKMHPGDYRDKLAPEIAITPGPPVGRLDGGKASMDDLTFTLSSMLGRRVVNNSGFTRTFDINLGFSLDREVQAGIGFPYRDWYAAIVEYSDEKYQHPPSIFDALRQIGMRLDSAQDNVEILVIDQVATLVGR